MFEETEKQNLEEKPQTVLSHLSDFLFSHYIKLNSHVNLLRRSTIFVCLFFHATIDCYLGPFCCKTSALAEFYMWPGACTLVSIYYEVATAFCARNKIAALANFSALWYLPTFIIFSFPNVLSAEGSELLAFIFIANNTSSSFSSSSLCLSVTLIVPF